MKDLVRFLLELEVMANQACELDPRLAICLYTIIGAAKLDRLDEIVDVCLLFCEQETRWLEKEEA